MTDPLAIAGGKTIAGLAGLYAAHAVEGAASGRRKTDGLAEYYRQTYGLIGERLRRHAWTGDDSEREDAIILLILLYSWMGQGYLSDLKPLYARYGQACDALRRLRAGALESPGNGVAGDLAAVVGFCNNSVIGTSKLLHFLEPERFAIWDSRIAAALGASISYASVESQIDQYLTYLDWINANISQVPPFTGCDWSSLRRLEFLLFMHGDVARNDAKLRKAMSSS